MAFYIWVEVGVQLKLIITSMWIVNSVNIWVWIGKLFIPYFIPVIWRGKKLPYNLYSNIKS